MDSNIVMQRSEFPLLKRRIHDHPLTYLDAAASTPRPTRVSAAMLQFERQHYANVHRGVYQLAGEATEAYEQARAKVASFIHAPAAETICFTKGATAALNLVAFGYAAHQLHTGDEIVISAAEHHSNLVPWQQVAHQTGASLKIWPLTPEGLLDMNQLAHVLTKKTKIVALAQVTNVLGEERPIAQIAAAAHAVGAIMVVDGAQAVAHQLIDVQALGADFYAFSGHKMYGPTGIGVLYGRSECLAKTFPVEFGGEMIDRVTLTTTTFKQAPWKFEAGTPPIVQAIGLGAACDFLMQVDRVALRQQEEQLRAQAATALAAISGVTVYGPLTLKGTVISFNLANCHPHDAATALDYQGIAVRAGHHCAEPMMKCLQTSATIRASLGLFNNAQDIDNLVAAVAATKEFFQS